MPKIEGYALLGDLHTAALVGTAGSIDWLCLPRFDSPAAFAALLHNEEAGHWTLAPAAANSRATRRYAGNTSDPFVSSVIIALVHHLPRSVASAHAAALVLASTGALREGGARRPGPAAVSGLSLGPTPRWRLRKQPTPSSQTVWH